LLYAIGDARTLHQSGFEFHGESDLIYTQAALPNGSDYRRSPCPDRII
jgi:hypothetical protein